MDKGENHESKEEYIDKILEIIANEFSHMIARLEMSQ
jgi:hypothetical protein